MYKIILIIILFLIASFGFKSQTLEDNVLQKKVKTSNNNNVGKINVNIPLYDINIPGYSFSASLEYLQERLIGETLKNETTIVGTNWNLNSTGKIVISNTSLENVRSPQKIAWSPNGFHTSGYYNCLIPETVSSVSKKQILENPNPNLTSYNPNTFYFDFMGNKGYFVYDNMGQFLVYSESEVFQITYNGSKCHNVFAPINEFPEIIIKDSKGNQFYFGGDYNSTDVHYYKTKYDYHSWYDDGTFIHSENFFTNKHVNFLSTLYLKKIKLANSKTIDFFYKNSNKSILDTFTNGGIYVNDDYNSSTNIPSNNTLLSNNIFFGGVSNISYIDSNTPNSGTNAVITNNTYSKFAILDSIKVSDIGTLNFSYIQLNNNNTKPFLKKIELKSNHKIIKNINFDYNLRGNYVYLNTVNVNDEVYNFDYYNYDFSISANGGLLKKIIYPTKGWDEFEYESNNASKFHRIYRGYNESEAIVDQNPPISTTGERIKEIKSYYNDNNTPLIRKYNYNGDNGVSSGISNTSDEVQYSKVTEEITGKEKNEYYFTDIITNPDSIATKKYTDKPSINLNVVLNNKLPIKINKSNERGKILKIVNLDSNNFAVSTKTFKYTNFLKNANPINDISNNCATCKISDSKYYIIAQKIQYEPSVNGSAPYYIGFYQYQPVLPYLPISVFTEEIIPYQIIDGTYFGGKLIDSEKHLKYNNSYLYWHPYPIETTDYLPYPWVLPNTAPVYMGKIISRTSYPQDLIRNNPTCITGNCPTDNDQVGGKFSIYKHMVDNNIIMPVIQSELNERNKTLLQENIFIKDNSSGNLLKIGKTRASLLDSNFTLDTSSSAAVEDKEIFQLYDNLGNLLQSTKSDGIPTTIIYGYKQTLPIAEIKGITYSQLMQIFGLPNTSTSYLALDIVTKSNSDTDLNSEQLLINALDSFKNNTSLSSYQVSTYTYDPLIGVTSATTPSGMREVYLYDTTNRLKEVRQQEKDNAGNTVYKTIKEVKYHYKN